MNWGPFTYCRDASAEQTINGICHQVRDIVASHVASGSIRVLALIGGYGRGEGGVEMTEYGARPHNNLDFLLVTQGLSAEATQAAITAVNQDLAPIRNQFDVGIDFSAITEHKLKNSDCLVMWYDMRHGHRLIAGDEDFLPSLTKFDVAHIPAWNVRDLLVNRGTLLILNRWLSEALSDTRQADGATHDALSRQLIRHLAKAIIGYGDALLYFDGQYHWSYVEKMHRINYCHLTTPEFARLYTDAAEFRLCPDYRGFSSLNILGWQAEVMPMLADAHLRCESTRLAQQIGSWEKYAAIAMREEFWRQRRSPKTWARKAIHVVKSCRQTPGLSPFHWGARCAGARGRMSLAFPMVAYEVREFYSWAQQLLGGGAYHGCSEQQQRDQLLTSYVEHWGRIGDANFRFVLERYASRTSDDSRMSDASRMPDVSRMPDAARTSDVSRPSSQPVRDTASLSSTLAEVGS